MKQPLKAIVRNGRLVVDAPTELPEGTEVELVAIADEGWPPADPLLSARPAALTPLEKQIVAHVKLGQGVKQIAKELGMSPSTVSVLLGRAARKRGVRTRSDLISANVIDSPDSERGSTIR